MFVTANGSGTRNSGILAVAEEEESSTDLDFAKEDAIMSDLKKQADAIRHATMIADKGKQDAELVTHLSDKVRHPTISQIHFDDLVTRGFAIVV